MDNNASLDQPGHHVIRRVLAPSWPQGSRAHSNAASPGSFRPYKSYRDDIVCPTDSGRRRTGPIYTQQMSNMHLNVQNSRKYVRARPPALITSLPLFPHPIAHAEQARPHFEQPLLNKAGVSTRRCIIAGGATRSSERRFAHHLRASCSKEDATSHQRMSDTTMCIIAKWRGHLEEEVRTHRPMFWPLRRNGVTYGYHVITQAAVLPKPG